ncbi:RNA polymerase sigma factor [Desulfobacterota bacterium M19]
MVNQDARLMARAAGGDVEAFGGLVRRHQNTAWRIAYRFLGDSAEAEDIVQEAFLRIWEAAPRYRPTAAFSSYLYRVVVRLCIDNARKKRPMPVDNIVVADTASPGPAAALIRREREALIRQTLNALSARQRMAVILKYYEGLSYGEIAQALTTTTKAVERLLGRAREALKRQLSNVRKKI